ncbi:uncharacterized protein LOC125235802 [Leguminivora glycinivorella]|uniref:uncharacterized protein LOC125235802 n=1 Tax=Leguminivora glycinivorella TaxID=1035111 RepID=UPI0020100BCC|nr:uncharacterized protein LOC125235802 [Leguminivora glycinivorella]
MSQNDSKITVLQLIRDKKDILFGSFRDRLTKDKNIAEWKNVSNLALSLGLVPVGNDYTYVRDTFYLNLKISTLSKRDDARKTGTGGGKKIILTPTDELILEIIGKDSPILDGINVEASTSELPLDQNDVHESSQVSQIQIDNETTSNADSNSLAGVTEKEKTKIVRKGSKQHDDVLDQETKKKRKLDLQLEFLELQNYKMKLEIFELEQKLEVKPSNILKK